MSSSLRHHPAFAPLVTATAVNSLGRGISIVLLALHLAFTFDARPAAVGGVLTVAGAIGVATSILAGRLADQLPPRRLLPGCLLGEAVALAALALSPGLATATVSACVLFGSNRAASTVRSTVVGTVFTGADRVNARAVLRVTVNAGIAVGSLAAAIPLAIGSAGAFRTAFVVAAAAYVGAAVAALGLPAATQENPDSALVARRGGSPWRDRRYVTFAVLNALFMLQFAVYEVAVPLWLVDHTEVPAALVSPLLVLNTVVVVTLQVRLSRGTDDPVVAGRLMARAGWLMGIASLAWAAVAQAPLLVAVVIAVIAASVHSVAEVIGSAAGWGLGYAFADHEQMGAYQGVLNGCMSVSSMIAPAVVTVLAVEGGARGWAALAALFVLAGVLTRRLATRTAPQAA
ncbi:MFS transporter [Aeromicrobium phragmitis]|uniref:MFS transporter n=1 Tax=Aeromicrobium phragmitis TaxID=2478914 RepID=UPI00140CF872|nr:MFS transporter [Aeromicrobium phragmitis]